MTPDTASTTLSGFGRIDGGKPQNQNQRSKTMKQLKTLLAIALVSIMTILFTACTEADTVSDNISKAADSFEVERRIVFFNGITDKYLLTIEGLCSLGNNDKAGELSVTCKVGENKYKKHFLGLSDNVSYLVEQTDAVNVDPFHYRIIFRPESIIPDIDLQTSK